MKSYLFKIATCLCLITLTACWGYDDGKYPVFPEQPTQKALPGFQWETVSGAGLQFWAQRDSLTCVVTDGLLEAAFVKRTNYASPSGRPVISIFHIQDGDIDDVLDQLKESTGWKSEETCKFKEEEGTRKGVTRYVLVPTGDYADRIEAAMANGEAIPSTCNGWGMGNSGRRYFEIHDNCPDKAIFVEIGQEKPLFDPESIVLYELPLQTVKGELTMGHEAHTFTASGDTTVFWVKDLTGKLQQEYDQVTQGVRNGYPVYAEFQVRNMGKSYEGFAAAYAGVYEVTDIREIKTVELTAGKNNDTRKYSADSLSALVTSSTLDIIYTPTPGEKDIEVTAPENILQYVEVYTNEDGTLLINMKHYPDISSDTPFSIELKAPPISNFYNKGKGTLILKDGIYSDGDVRITAEGTVICGPVTCRDLYITTIGSKIFHADQQLTCRDLVLRAQSHSNIDLSGGITCRLIDAHAENEGGIAALHLSATDVVANSSSLGTLYFTGSCTKATLSNAAMGCVSTDAMQCVDATVEITGGGITSCHATRKITAEINGEGKLLYKGRPRIVCRPTSARKQIQPITGSGSPQPPAPSNAG